MRTWSAREQRSVVKRVGMRIEATTRQTIGHVGAKGDTSMRTSS